MDEPKGGSLKSVMRWGRGGKAMSQNNVIINVIVIVILGALNFVEKQHARFK